MSVLDPATLIQKYCRQTSTGGVYVLFSLFIPELHWSCSVLRSDCVCTGQLPGVSVCNCVNVLRAFLQMRGLLSEKHP